MKLRLFIRSIQRTVLVATGIFLIGGCEFEEPEITNFGGFKLKKIEGKHIDAEFSVDCENLNGFAFKMKKADIDVSLGDQKLGKITLDKKIKIRRKSKERYTIPLSFDLEDGVLIKLMQLSLKKEVTLNFAGKVRGSVYGFSKSFDVNETKTFDGSVLQMGRGE